MWYCIVEAGPVGECVSPDIGAEEVLPVDGGGDVAQNCLDVTLDGVLPLLVWCRCLVAALVVLVEGDALVRAERGEVVAAEDAGLESAGGEESKDPFEVVEEGVFITLLDRDVE